MTVQRSFTPTPDSVAEARHFVLDQLPRLPHSAREQISLIVSELATNAVLHAATSYTIAMELADGTLTLEVTDESSLAATPAEAPPPPDQPHGRGLLIVTQLAAEWGVTTKRLPSGKTVWVKLLLGTPDGRSRTGDAPLV